MSKYDDIMRTGDPVDGDSPVVPRSFTDAFERDGVTIELAREKAALYRELHHVADIYDHAEQRRRADLARSLWGEDSTEGHPDVFYLNTSDGIETLYSQCDVAGKRVLTIGGSGDAWQVFLLKGALEIQVYDISLPGVLWNDIKDTALRTLTFKHYQQIFSLEGWDEARSGKLWLNLPLYKYLRSHISPQAKTFFDTLCNFPKGDSLVLAHPNKQFCRYRGYGEQKENGSTMVGYLQTVGTIVKDEESYNSLQTRAQETPINIRRRDIATYLQEENVPEVIFLSNIYYDEFETVKLALKFFEIGSQRVIMTMVPNVIVTLKNTDGSLTMYPMESAKGKKNEYGEKDFLDVPVGTAIYLDGIKTRFLGCDPRVSCSVMLELRREDIEVVSAPSEVKDS